jgi:hypothetical protein
MSSSVGTLSSAHGQCYDPNENLVEVSNFVPWLADAIVNINMIHISPWAAAEGLMAGGPTP